MIETEPEDHEARRYVVFGAGAVGAAIGGRLHQCGVPVVLVARGAHLQALQKDGLLLRDPERTDRLRVRAVATIAEVAPRRGDVVVLAMKTEDAEAALVELAAVADPTTPVVCAQNGVENERLARRRFLNVYGMRVVIDGVYVRTGIVDICTSPSSGVLDLGCYPEGLDDVAGGIVADLQRAGFDARATQAIMSVKYRKLLDSLANAVQAACGAAVSPAVLEVFEAARQEALRCYEAAGIELCDEDEEVERRRRLGPTRAVDGVLRQGTSSWQSLQRKTGRIEADWLNGEIVLLGGQWGVATPVNLGLQRLANELARTRATPGTMSGDELARLVLPVGASGERR